MNDSKTNFHPIKLSEDNWIMMKTRKNFNSPNFKIIVLNINFEMHKRDAAVREKMAYNACLVSEEVKTFAAKLYMQLRNTGMTKVQFWSI